MPEDDADRLAALERRIAEMRARDAPAPHQESHHHRAQLAWRMVVELVAGLLIGFGMGYGLDAVFGTTPWFLVTFTLLGFAAGVKTMIASAQEVQARMDAADAKDGDA